MHSAIACRHPVVFRDSAVSLLSSGDTALPGTAHERQVHPLTVTPVTTAAHTGCVPSIKRGKETDHAGALFTINAHRYGGDRHIGGLWCVDMNRGVFFQAVA